MASLEPLGSPRIGRYRVHLDVVETHGANAIWSAIQSCQLICIDEIGKMELLSPKFVTSVRNALNAPVQVLGTMGRNIRHPLIQELQTRTDTEILELTKHNRNDILNKIRTNFQFSDNRA
jgi:nucleoside-triphosphatase